MKEKGFTLIELLAVIVILAIIALIATPIVLNIIEDSKKSSFLQTGNGIVDAAEYYYMNEMSDGVKPTKDKVFTFDESIRNIEGLEFDGEIPQVGTVTVAVNGNVELVAHNNQYCIIKGYEDDEVTIKDYDGNCEIPSICTLVNDVDNSGTITPGDKYRCKVKDDMEPGFEDGYYFYVLSLNEEGTANLIMDRNICENGTVVTETKDCVVAWQTSGLNTDGPVTAMDYLYNATKKWTNIPNIIMNYKDEGNIKNCGYGTITTVDGVTKLTKKDVTAITVLTNQEGYINLKARMPYLSEVSKYSEASNNAYLYDNLDGGCYDDNRIPADCDVATIKIGVLEEGITHISGVVAYWTLASNEDDSWYAWYVSSSGSVSGAGVGVAHSFGVRPVITLKI